MYIAIDSLLCVYHIACITDFRIIEPEQPIVPNDPIVAKPLKPKLQISTSLGITLQQLQEVPMRKWSDQQQKIPHIAIFMKSQGFEEYFFREKRMLVLDL